MKDIPTWVWIAGGGVLLLVLLASGKSSGGSSYQAATPADGGATDASGALQAKQATLAQLINYAGSVDLAKLEADANKQQADIAAQAHMLDVQASEAVAKAQAQYAYEAQNTVARQATKQSFWDAVGNTALGVAAILTSRGNRGTAVGTVVPPRSSSAWSLQRPTGGYGSFHGF